jgi:hypothetical protein
MIPLQEASLHDMTTPAFSQYALVIETAPFLSQDHSTRDEHGAAPDLTDMTRCEFG